MLWVHVLADVSVLTSGTRAEPIIQSAITLFNLELLDTCPAALFNFRVASCMMTIPSRAILPRS